MTIDLNPYFAEYEGLVQVVDGIFDKVKKEFPKKFSAGRNVPTAVMLFLT